MANYFYNEWFEILVGVVVWKGVYDLVETGSQQLFYSVQPNPENEYWVSLIFTAVLGYGTFFIWLIFDKTIRLKSHKIFHKYTTYFIDLIDFIVYLAMVAIWRVIWQQFDIFAFDTRIFENDQESGVFVCCCFAGCIVIFSILGLNSNFFGLANAPEGVAIEKKTITNKSHQENVARSSF